MRSRYPNFNLFAILGMLLVLGMARGLDLAAHFFARPANPLFSPSQAVISIWSYAFSTLLLGAAVLILYWFMGTYTGRNAWVAWLYLVTGLLILLYPALYYTPALAGRLPDIAFLQITNQTGYFHSAAGFIALTGLFTLILRKRA
jgi:hypothetical protein